MPQNNRRGGDDDFSFEIVKHYGVLSTSQRGWNKEFNSVVWNGRDPKYDIREWQPDHQKMSKGVTLTGDEVGELLNILNDNAAEFDSGGGEDEDSNIHAERLVS
ncbi:MAG: PC4/YdbC family ssDNA-binding protein [Eubacteriales bacterium]|nr:PC4/YdbC family ssDNA-binding protein [Eubacteriales bacterium]